MAFERDLGDGWTAGQTEITDGAGQHIAQFDLRGPNDRLAAWMEDGGYEHASGAAIPAKVLLAFLDAYRDWSLQQPEGSPDRAVWESSAQADGERRDD